MVSPYLERTPVSEAQALAESADEIERLNKWADSFSDAQLKERALAEQVIRELRETNSQLLTALIALVRRLDEHFGGNPDADWREQAEARTAIAKFIGSWK